MDEVRDEEGSGGDAHNSLVNHYFDHGYGLPRRPAPAHPCITLEISPAVLYAARSRTSVREAAREALGDPGGEGETAGVRVHRSHWGRHWIVSLFDHPYCST